jgi:hypothetical protein
MRSYHSYRLEGHLLSADDKGPSVLQHNVDISPRLAFMTTKLTAKIYLQEDSWSGGEGPLFRQQGVRVAMNSSRIDKG